MKKPGQKKTLINEGYKNDLVNLDSDMALVRLEHKVSISTNITPICLPGKEDRFQMRANGRVELRRGALLFCCCMLSWQPSARKNIQMCTQINHLPENLPCAGAEGGGGGACQGDSGGPLLGTQASKRFIMDIVSWRLDCALAGQNGV